MTDLTQIFGPRGFDAAAYERAATQSNPAIEFKAAAEAFGLVVDAITGDGHIHRCKDSREDKGRSGWYVFYPDGIAAGAYGSWKRDEQATWSAKSPDTMTPVERAAHAARVERLKADQARAREEGHKAAADDAAQFLATLQAEPGDHPYLKAKGVAAHGLYRTRDGRLVVPRFDAHGQLWSYQTISAAGDKLFAKGARAKGTFYAFGGAISAVVYIAEGYATAASVHAATGKPVAVAFNAGNLEAVAVALREQHPAAQIIVCADDDSQTAGNPGLTAATSAAHAVNGRLAVPAFPAPGAGTDWNDLAQMIGVDGIRAQLEERAAPRLALVSMAELLTAAKPPDWLIKGIEERNTLSVTFGEPGAAKSFYAIDKALCVAHGVEWKGRRTRQGVVVYVAGEGHGGIARRVMAWRIKNGQRETAVPFYVTPHRIAMMVPEEAQKLAEALATVGDRHGGIDKIVLDTLARNMGGDENSTADMNAFVAALDHYLRVPFGALVETVHHTGWAALDRMRGSRALEAACDAACAVAKDAGGLVTIEAKRMKDGELFDPMHFRLESIALPLQDEDGNTLTSAVLTPTESHEEVESGLRPQDRRALEWLRGKYLETGMNLKAQGRDASAARVEIRGWKDGTKEVGIWKGDRSVFSKIMQRLEESGHVQRDGVFIVLTTPNDD